MPGILLAVYTDASVAESCRSDRVPESDRLRVPPQRRHLDMTSKIRWHLWQAEGLRGNVPGYVSCPLTTALSAKVLFKGC